MTPQPREWTFEPFDAGMGETEYNIFADDVFFARVNNRADVASLIHAMKLANPRPAPSPELIDSTKGMEQKSETKSPDGRYHLCRSDASRHTCINVDEFRKEAAAQAHKDLFTLEENEHMVVAIKAQEGWSDCEICKKVLDTLESLRTEGGDE